MFDISGGKQLHFDDDHINPGQQGFGVEMPIKMELTGVLPLPEVQLQPVTLCCTSSTGLSSLPRS